MLAAAVAVLVLLLGIPVVPLGGLGTIALAGILVALAQVLEPLVAHGRLR